MYKIGTQWVHDSTLHVFCKLCSFFTILSGGRIRFGDYVLKILGVGELLYFSTELLMWATNGSYRRPVQGIKLCRMVRFMNL